MNNKTMCGDKYLKSQVSSSFSFFEPGLQLTSEIYKAEMEGPTVVKWDNVYYLFYSANHFKSKNYGVGYATSGSPMGPWKKYEGNPILQRADGLMGTGHGAAFRCKDGSWKYIFHAHWDSTKVQPRTSYIKDFAISDQRTVSIGGPLIRPQVLTDNLTSK